MSIKHGRYTLLSGVLLPLASWLIWGSSCCWAAPPDEMEVGSTGAAARIVMSDQIVVWTDDKVKQQPTVGYNDLHGEFLVTWGTKQDIFTHDIWARRIGIDGTVHSGLAVTTTSGKILGQPVVTTAPPHDQYAIVYTNWGDPDVDRADVLGRLIAWDAGWSSSQLTVTPGTTRHIDPDIAYNSLDDEYLVVYTNEWPGDEIDIYAQRINASDGTLLSMSTVASDAVLTREVSKVAYHPGAYSGSGGYVITYLAGANAGGPEVRYKVCKADLSDLFSNPEQEISNTTDSMIYPNVEAGDSGFLVVWGEYTSSDYQVMARRLNVEGAALGPAGGFAVSPVYSFYPLYSTIQVATTYHGSYLVAWVEESATQPHWDIHTTLASENGDRTFGGVSSIGGGIDAVRYPAIVCSNDATCLIAYEWPHAVNFDIAARIVQPLTAFVDGFESGDTARWSSTVP